METESKRLKSKVPSSSSEEQSNNRKNNKRIKKLVSEVLEATGVRLCTSFMFKNGSATAGWFSPPSKTHLIAEELVPDSTSCAMTNHLEKCENIIKYLRLLTSDSKKSRQKGMPIKSKMEVKLEAFYALMSERNPTLIPPTLIAKTLGISRRTASNWIKKLIEVNPINVTRGRKRVLKKNIVDCLHQYFNAPQNKYATVRNAHKYLQKKFKTLSHTIKLSTLYRYMRTIGYTKKNVINVSERLNYPLHKQQRKKLCEQTISLLYSDFQFVYIDETSFHLQNNTPKTAWSKRGKKIYNRIGIKSINYSLLCAISPTKIIGAKIYKGGVTGDDFFSFILECFKSNPFIERSQKYSTIFR